MSFNTTGQQNETLSQKKGCTQELVYSTLLQKLHEIRGFLFILKKFLLLNKITKGLITKCDSTFESLMETS